MENNKEYYPPTWINRLLKKFLDPLLIEGISGDLHELYQKRLNQRGKLLANIYLIMAAFEFWRHNPLKKSKNTNLKINYLPMFRNYFKVGLRNILRRKIFAGINIFGLAISMSICLLIISIIMDLKSYDQFHPDKEKIYRVISDQFYDGNFFSAAAVAPLALGSVMDNYSEVEDVSLLRRNLNLDIRVEDKVVAMRGLFADKNFFEFFGFTLIEGDIKSCLNDPNGFVISEELKFELFNEENALGQLVSLGNFGEFKVSGVAKTNKVKSHIRFDALASISTLKILENQKIIRPETDNWTALNNGMVYIKTSENPDRYLMNQINQIGNDKYANSGYSGTSFRAQPITEIYMGEDLDNQIIPGVPKVVIYSLAGVALIVLALAIFNYTNLTLAQSLSRSKEIGIRKTNGASRGAIYWQLIVEAVILSLISCVLALVILQFLATSLKQLIALQFLSIGVNNSLTTYLLFFGFTILVGLLAGFFPAIYLSRISPLNSLQLKGKNLLPKMNWKKILVGIQFTFCSIFLITTILTQKQVDYILYSDYGFDKSNVINIPLKDAPYEVFNREILSHPNIVSVSSSQGIPGLGDGDRFGVKVEGIEEYVLLNYLIIDHNFIDNLGLELMIGENFADNPQQVNETKIIINQTAIKMLGWNSPDEAIGKTVDADGPEPLQIIGVIKDFNYMNKVSRIRGLALRYNPNQYYISSVKFSSANPTEIITYLEKTWKKYDSKHVFEYKFYDDQIMFSYFDFIDISKILRFFSLLIIIIASLGLFAMTIFWTESRLKEVGIRKVMGATVRQIFLKLNTSLALLIVLSFAVSIPVALFLNNLWLEEFAYKVDFGTNVFVLAFGIISILAIAVSIYPTLKVTTTNPVNIIRDE